MPDPTRALLLVTTDPDTEREVARVAASTGVDLLVRPPTAVGDDWHTAPLVLIDASEAEPMRLLAPRRRPEVWLVSVGRADLAACRAGIALGVQDLLELTDRTHRLGVLLSDLADRMDRVGDARDRPGDRGVVVGVVGAAGGVGASVLAVALAQVAADHDDVALVDLGGGPPATLLCGLENEPGVGWRDLAGLDGSLGARELRESLPRRDRLGVLSADPVEGDGGEALPEAALRAVVGAAARGHPWVVLDLGRGLGSGLDLCDAVAVVATPTLAGVPGALRVAGRLPPQARAGLVVRGGHGFADDLAVPTGLPVWAGLRRQRGLDEHLAAGLGPVRSRRSPYARAARAVLAHAADVTPAPGRRGLR